MPTDLDQETTAALSAIPRIMLGGMEIAVLDRRAAAALLLRLARRRHGRPLYFTSANGEVLARVAADPELAALFAAADQVVADGQPLVTASRLLSRQPLPERVATTDLFHDTARLAAQQGESFYFFGATEGESARAAANTRTAYPGLRLLGHSHGYLSGDALDAKLAEINAVAPDVLWLGLGVPREQHFVREHGHKLPNVGLIKTSGGLFNFLSGSKPRAPGWMQAAGLEWLWRTGLEPRRLLRRYITTNPVAVYLLLTKSR